MVATSVVVLVARAPRNTDHAQSEARQRTEKMFELMRTISAESDVEQMIQCIMNATISVVKADGVTMYLVDEEAQELIVSQSQDIRGARIPIQAGIAGHVARTGETLNIVDAHQDPRFDDSWDRKTNYRTRSMMCLPVKDQHGKVVACLQVSACWLPGRSFRSRCSTTVTGHQQGRAGGSIYPE